MCQGCEKAWTALQILWSATYIVCGAAQLIIGTYFCISASSLNLNCNIGTGCWNVVIGLGGGMLACFKGFSPRRQEILLYMAASILIVNIANALFSEWSLYMVRLEEQENYTPLMEYALFTIRISFATTILVSFLDSQLAFCSMQIAPKKQRTNSKKKTHSSVEQVSDIEYIIPRKKSSKPNSSPANVYSAYNSQSWVFDSDVVGGTTTTIPDLNSPYLKILENGNRESPLLLEKQNHHSIVSDDTSHLIDNPVVLVEEASDDSNSNSDRKLCHMKSFSRSTSPVFCSVSSSRSSLNQPVEKNAPIYECLETIYRSRLNTGASDRTAEVEEPPRYQAPVVMTRRAEATSPQVMVEKVQYASLMKELQRAIVHKKEPTSTVTSPLSTESGTVSDSKSSEYKSSDAEFSKELEAALQLIQDLESPNTIDTPSKGRPMAMCGSGSEKTLSAVGSLAEIASPLIEAPSDFYTQSHHHHHQKPPPPPPPPPDKGKEAAVGTPPDSQSTSGYSSPFHVTPTWSTTSSLNGSNTDMLSYSYSIRNAKSSTVISFYPPTTTTTAHSTPRSRGGARCVTLVNISAPAQPPQPPPPPPPPRAAAQTGRRQQQQEPPTPPTSPTPAKNAAAVWLSLLRKKKLSPKMRPELEEAIVKSESLAHLSDRELVDRQRRTEEMHRKIEERVIQRFGGNELAS